MGAQSENQETVNWPNEDLIETSVQYVFATDDHFFVFENVPARVNRVTGEQLFAPTTVRRIQQIVLSAQKPDRIVQAKVYDWKHAA